MKFYFGILLLIIISCNSSSNKNYANDKLLAKVYDKPLYLSELSDIFSDQTMSKADSNQLIANYVERWVRDNAIMYEAEKNVPKDLNLDKLVKNYRSSLVRSIYEKSIIEEALDSTVTLSELNDFYDKNKDQYQLETPIVRCYLIKLEKNAPDQDAVRDWWDDINEADNLKRLLNYCKSNAKVYMLDDKMWYKVEDLVGILPNGKISPDNVHKEEMTFKDDNFQYFFKIIELVNKKETAPMSYIKDQAIKYILHKRKMKLLDEKIENIYNKELLNKNIEIYNLN
jgi:hypothetical protein